MRTVATRVTTASVVVDGEVVGAVGTGGANDHHKGGAILALVGVGIDDLGEEDGARGCEYTARKLADLRILRGERSLSDLVATDERAEILVVSQFTLYGSTRRGRRPSWSQAAPGPAAEAAIERVVAQLRERGITVATGRFGADMEVHSVNDGPFTVLIDTAQM